MSSSSLVTIILLAAVAVGGAALWWSGYLTTLSWPAPAVVTEQQNTQETAEQTPPRELATGDNASDQALEQDAAQLDAEIEALAGDSSQVDASLSDQPAQ